MTTETHETIDARIARLDLHATVARYTVGKISDSRRESLALAHAAGVSDEALTALATATRLRRGDTIVLPAHRFEGLSRGRGWARLGRGDNAKWGEKVDGGYRVSPGRWTVGGNDGFRRKGEDTWMVEHITVGDETWTVAS